jgi:hypothetical protein
MYVQKAVFRRRPSKRHDQKRPNDTRQTRITLCLSSVPRSSETRKTIFRPPEVQKYRLLATMQHGDPSGLLTIIELMGGSQMKLRSNINKLAGIALMSIITLSGIATAQSKTGEAGTPVGVWDVLISFRDCNTGEVTRTRPGMMSFMNGGIMQEFGTGSAPQDRSDAQGVWWHETGRSFTSVSKFYRFATDGTFVGSAKLYRQFDLTLDGSGINAYVRAEIYDPSGNLVGMGCSTESGERLQ